MKRTMGQRLLDTGPLVGKSLQGVIKITCLELLPDIGLCIFGRMKQIGFVETIVAQVVEHDLKCRKILHIVKALLQRMTCDAEYAFAYTVQYQRVLDMPYGADG